MSARGAAAVLGGVIGLVLWTMPHPAHASSLANQLDNLFGQTGITLDVRPINPAFPPHTAHFRSASLEQLGTLTGTLSAEASDFPAVSTAPGFTYQYDEKLQVFTPVQGSLGSIFVERQPDADKQRTKPFPLGAGKDKFGLGFQIASSDPATAGFRSPGSLSWAGIFNTEFWVDPVKHVGGVHMMQLLPFYDDGAIRALRGFEETVYKNLP